MSVFGTSRGFGALCVFGAAVTGLLVARDFTTEDELVAVLRRKNNQAGRPEADSEVKKFNELLRQIKDPTAENKTFEELLKRGVKGRSTPMKPVELPPVSTDDSKEAADSKDK